jgi:acyl dehydratase
MGLARKSGVLVHPDLGAMITLPCQRRRGRPGNRAVSSTFSGLNFDAIRRPLRLSEYLAVRCEADSFDVDFLFMSPRFFEEYAVGSERRSTGRTITETDIVMHAGQTGDFYPHHMDAEWCKTQDFKQRIAHGTLIFSVAVGQTAGEINPVAFSYGYDRLRFIKPVFIGDTITARCTVKEKRDHPKRADYGVVVELVESINQRGETVLAAEHLLLVKRRPSAAA